MSLDDSHFPTVQPDDFWKHLREWDFVSHYYKCLHPPEDDDNHNSSSKSEGGGPSKPSSGKVIPNTFLNHRHYVAAWAPMCLAECRAQVLQEWTTNGSVDPILVKVESTHSRVRATSRGGAGHGPDRWNAMADEVDTGGHVILTIPRHAASRGPPLSFMNGDICLLIQSRYQNLLADLSRGTTVQPVPGKEVGDYSTAALIGHTESSRNDLNGLILKVSKRKWAKIGQPEMFLLKLGCNVTALREFTALAKVETLPMKRFLLGQHLEQNQVTKLSHLESADGLLRKMGGTQALGDGFIRFAKAKFNSSQLTAIAASAHEYGDGGFTLIKGPPGTGSTYFAIWVCLCFLVTFVPGC